MADIVNAGDILVDQTIQATTTDDNVNVENQTTNNNPVNNEDSTTDTVTDEKNEKAQPGENSKRYQDFLRYRMDHPGPKSRKAFRAWANNGGCDIRNPLKTGRKNKKKKKKKNAQQQHQQQQ